MTVAQWQGLAEYRDRGCFGGRAAATQGIKGK